MTRHNKILPTKFDIYELAELTGIYPSRRRSWSTAWDEVADNNQEYIDASGGTPSVTTTT